MSALLNAPSPTAALAPHPRGIFRYITGELLGEGSHGRVYMGMNNETGDLYAVKQATLTGRASATSMTIDTAIDALKTESEMLRDLDHPNIVQYLGFEETPSRLSLFVEYVPAGSLGSLVHNYGAFEDSLVKQFTRQILCGVEYVHAQGLIHRHIKPNSILVTNTGICKLSDFGFCTPAANPSRSAPAALGAVFYMAPELARPDARARTGYSTKVDVWSVGCVVLAMWTARRPWCEDDAAVAVMFKLLAQDAGPPVPAGVALSPLAAEFKDLCFAIDPDARPIAKDLRQHAYLL